MKLEYKILWIDDTPAVIKRPKKKIKEYLEELGFTCYINEINQFSTFVADIGYENTKDYDLLLVDLDLGDEDLDNNGEKIIREIRNQKVYAEVIFYSSNYEPLLRKINQNFIEGIFTSSRDELEDKVIDIIDITIKKTQDVNNLRGLIMAEVAELDRIKKSILLKYNQNDIELKTYIKNDVFEKINNDLVDLECIVDANCTPDKVNIQELLNSFFYDSFKKSRTVFKIRKLDNNCSSIPFVHQDYYDKVIKKRNVFAHEEEQTRNDGSKYLNYPNKKPLEFTTEHCIEIRKDIKKYKKLLLEIEKSIEK